MNKPINKDIDAYRQDAWKGLSWREIGWGTAALIVGVAVILLLYVKVHIPINVATLMAMPFICIIGYNGFYQKNGQTAYVLLKKIIKIRFQKPLTYQSSGQRKFEAILINEAKKTKKKGKKGRQVE